MDTNPGIEKEIKHLAANIFRYFMGMGLFRLHKSTVTAAFNTCEQECLSRKEDRGVVRKLGYKVCKLPDQRLQFCRITVSLSYGKKITHEISNRIRSAVRV